MYGPGAVVEWWTIAGVGIGFQEGSAMSTTSTKIKGTKK